jgi:hypothetical protein
MLKSLSLDRRTTAESVNVIAVLAGLGLGLSPWYLGYAEAGAAAWNAWIVGAGIVVFAALTLFAFHQAEDWANLALGIWAAIAPWVLGFTTMSDATAAHVVAGVVAAIIAATSLWFASKRPYSTI